MKYIVLLATCVALLVTVSAQTTPCFPCDASWPRPLYYPDFDDCGYIWECSDGQLKRTSCDSGLVFEFLLQACVTDGPEMLFTCKKLLGKSC